MPDADHGSGFGCLFHSKFARMCGEIQLQAGFSPELHSPVVLAWLQRQLVVSPTAKRERGALPPVASICGRRCSQTGAQGRLDRLGGHDPAELNAAGQPSTWSANYLAGPLDAKSMASVASRVTACPSAISASGDVDLWQQPLVLTWFDQVVSRLCRLEFRLPRSFVMFCQPALPGRCPFQQLPLRSRTSPTSTTGRCSNSCSRPIRGNRDPCSSRCRTRRRTRQVVSCIRSCLSGVSAMSGKLLPTLDLSGSSVDVLNSNWHAVLRAASVRVSSGCCPSKYQPAPDPALHYLPPRAHVRTATKHGATPATAAAESVATVLATASGTDAAAFPERAGEADAGKLCSMSAFRSSKNLKSLLDRKETHRGGWAGEAARSEEGEPWRNALWEAFC